MSTIKDEKSAAKFHYIKTVSGKVVEQSIAFRVVSTYWQGVAPFPWYLNAKRPTPIGSTCVAHTSPDRLRQLAQLPSDNNDVIASLACVRLTGWPVISTVGSILGSTVKPMFTQFDCQSNVSINCRINSWSNCSSNCQIHTQTVWMRYYVSWKTTGYYTKDSQKLAARCPVSGCWPSCSYIVASKDEQLFPRDCCLEEAWRRRRKRRRRKIRIVTTKNKTSYIEILIANHTWPVE